MHLLLLEKEKSDLAKLLDKVDNDYTAVEEISGYYIS